MKWKKKNNIDSLGDHISVISTLSGIVYTTEKKKEMVTRFWETLNSPNPLNSSDAHHNTPRLSLYSHHTLPNRVRYHSLHILTLPTQQS